MIREIMAWKATGPGDLTILRAPDRRLTKLITPDKIVHYDNASVFEVTAVRLDYVEDIAELMADLAPRADTCSIRGALKPEFAGQPKVLRRSRPRPGVPERFVEVARSSLLVDLEGIPCPYGVDPTDPVLIGGALRMQLPMPFRTARCVVQLSSNAGIKRGARAHLWFMLSRPLVRAEIVRWLGDVPGVDLQVYVPVQPNYTAAPIFDGVDDPCIDGRLMILPGYPEVEVPELPGPEPRKAWMPARGHMRMPAATPRVGASWARQEIAKSVAAIRAARGKEGTRLSTFKHYGARALWLARAGGIDRASVERTLHDAGAHMFDHDPERVHRNVGGMLQWWSEQNG